MTIETAAATGCVSGCADATASAVLNGTRVGKLTIVKAGSGYQRAPAVQIDSAVASGCTSGCADAIGATATLGAGGVVSGLFISGDACGQGCTATRAGIVTSMGITRATLNGGGAGYLSPPGGAGFTGTPSVLIFNNNANNAGLGQGASYTATMAGGVVTGYSLNSAGAGYSSASVTVAGAGVAYFTIGAINNGGVSALTLADSGAGTYSGTSVYVTLPAPVNCAVSCNPAVFQATVASGGSISGAVQVYAGSGYDSNYDLGNYVPVADMTHQAALATATVSGGAVTAVTLPAAAVPQTPAVTVLTAPLETGTNIVPPSISATVDQTGIITDLVVNTPGSGYTLVPTIQIAPPANCMATPGCTTAAGQIGAMGVLAICTAVPSCIATPTGDSYSAIPSIGIDPPTAACTGICYAAAASANVSIIGISMSNQGSNYGLATTIVTLPPPMMLPKLAVEFRSYHHPSDAAYSDYGYHDDWGFFGFNIPAVGANSLISDALFPLNSATQTSGVYGIQIPMPAASITPQSFATNIRHDDNNNCEGSGCVAQYMAALMVDSLHRDNTYHFSSNTQASGLDNRAYTVSPSCDFPSTGNPALHGGGFIAGGVATGGAIASMATAALPSAPYAGGCTYDTSSAARIVTRNGGLPYNENGTVVSYHRVRVEARRYCDPTCSSCGNKGAPGYNYLQIAAYLDCDSAALNGASCSDMSQNLLVQGSQVFWITVTDVGANYSAAPTVSLVGGGGKGAKAKAYITADGHIDHIDLTARGSGYSSAPTVVFDSGTAAATASISGLPLNGAYAGANVYAVNYCTVDPGSTSFTASQQGLSALDHVIAGFTVGAGTSATANRGVLFRNSLVGTYGN